MLLSIRLVSRAAVQRQTLTLSRAQVLFTPELLKRAAEEKLNLIERLDVSKETQAAVKLLGELHRQFQDWPLALAAYNQGEKWVRNAIQTGGTRDAWKLVEQGLLNDYLPTFATTWLVMQQPQLVE